MRGGSAKQLRVCALLALHALVVAVIALWTTPARAADAVWTIAPVVATHTSREEDDDEQVERNAEVAREVSLVRSTVRPDPSRAPRDGQRGELAHLGFVRHAALASIRARSMRAAPTACLHPTFSGARARALGMVLLN